MKFFLVHDALCIYEEVNDYSICERLQYFTHITESFIVYSNLFLTKNTGSTVERFVFAVVVLRVRVSWGNGVR